jgi:hypothetical protein
VDVHALIGVLLEARIFLSRADSDFSWSSWDDASDAVAEVDALLAQLRDGVVPGGQLMLVFAPTGPMQEVSVSSGWGADLLALASRLDAALAPGPAVSARYDCDECSAVAGTVELVVSQGPAELRRETFTSAPDQPVPKGSFLRLHDVLAGGDAAALYAADPDYAPFFCPDCRASYCGAHWERPDAVDGWDALVRGRCPRGHERVLEV